MGFNLAFMRLPGAPSKRAVFRLANRLGLDEERLRRYMNSQEVESVIQKIANLHSRSVSAKRPPSSSTTS